MASVLATKADRLVIRNCHKMNFLRLPEYLISPLFEDEDIIAIDKPYGINTHTNDSKIEHSDFIEDGLIEMLEKFLRKKLHIIHRLDQTTTGVIIFGKTAQGAKKYSEFFFNRQVKKTYWFVTAQKSKNKEFTIDQEIVHKGKNLEASTHFQFLRASETHQLWQAKPWTGRNHQIRIHAQAGGIAILGDALYQGAPYPFLTLHNHRIEFPNGVVIESKAPVYFQDLDLLVDRSLTLALFESDRRQRLFSTQSQKCFRWVHGKDVSIDQFGEQLVLNWHKDSWTKIDQNRFLKFSEIVNKKLIIRAPGVTPLDSVWTAHEQHFQYECRSSSNSCVGLLLNQRLQRDWVFQNSREKSVLHLFSQNCGFGLAAAVGAASSVTCVDANLKSLNWGKRNFEMNSLDPAKYKFLCRDSLVFLKQALKQESKFDLVICDTPSFYRGEKGIFKIEKDLPALLENILRLVKPGGHLLFSTAHEDLSIDDLRKMILAAQKSLKLSLGISCIESALDFELPGERRGFKSFLIQA